MPWRVHDILRTDSMELCKLIFFAESDHLLTWILVVNVAGRESPISSGRHARARGKLGASARGRSRKGAGPSEVRSSVNEIVLVKPARNEWECQIKKL